MDSEKREGNYGRERERKEREEEETHKWGRERERTEREKDGDKSGGENDKTMHSQNTSISPLPPMSPPPTSGQGGNALKQAWRNEPETGIREKDRRRRNEG